MIRAAATLLSLCLASASAADAPGFTPPASPRVTAFDIDTPDGPLLFRGAVAVSPPNADFGGLSGAVRTPDGRFLAVSDRAHWARFRLTIEEGRLTGVEDVSTAPLRTADDEPASGRGWDAEGLTFGPDGRLWVSFEGDHRIAAYDEPLAAQGEERRMEAWREFSGNSGLEALATGPEGRLWAIRERSGAVDRPFPVFVLGGDGGSEKALPRVGPYLPTGADFGPDGRLYVTERDFSFTGGFRFRLRRLSWAEGPAPLEAETLIELPSRSRIDNVESIVIWEEGGRTLLLLISDDNFFPLQRNVFALFEVTG